MKEYGDLLQADAEWRERAEAFAVRVRDVSEFLAARGITPPTHAIHKRATYQDPCHLAHGQGIRAQPRELLRAIPGLRLVEMPDAERCCGSAGVYNLIHPEIAQVLQREKVRAILDAAPDVVVSANPGCMLQIAAGLRAQGSDLRVVHLARFLIEADARVAANP